MTFEQTNAGRLLLNHFVSWGEDNKYTVGCKERAWEMQTGFMKNYSVSDVRKIGAMANKKLKYTMFNYDFISE